MATDVDTSNAAGPAEVVQRLIDAFNGGAFDLGMRYIAADAVNHGPPPTVGLAGWRQSWVEMHTAFPDIHARIEQTVEQGDTVCHRYTLSGTNTGGDAPTGRRFEVLGMDMVRVRDGKIVEHWALADAAAMAVQLAGSAA
jgi:predicted ester cyclase